MSGERDLETQRREMAPRLRPETFVYCSFPDFRIPAGLAPIRTFREAEGVTAVVEKTQAEVSAGPYVFESHLITLTVHSSLDAVGILATLAVRLAGADIPCNVVAGYHHDHLFVPTDRAQQAMSLLGLISAPPCVNSADRNYKRTRRCIRPEPQCPKPDPSSAARLPTPPAGRVVLLPHRWQRSIRPCSLGSLAASARAGT